MKITDMLGVPKVGDKKIVDQHEYIGFPLDNKFEIEIDDLIQQIKNLNLENNEIAICVTVTCTALCNYLKSAKLKDNKTAVKFIQNYYRSVIEFSDYMDENNIANAIAIKQDKYKEAAEILFQIEYFRELDRKSVIFKLKFSDIKIQDLETLKPNEREGYKKIVCKRLDTNELLDFDIEGGIKSIMNLADLDIKHTGEDNKEILAVLNSFRSQNEAVYDYLFCPNRKQNLEN